MDASSPPLQPQRSNAILSTVSVNHDQREEPTAVHSAAPNSNSTAEAHSNWSRPAKSNPIAHNRIRRRANTSISAWPSSSSLSSTSSPQRGVRVACKSRNPRAHVGSIRRRESDVQAIALPLGMSIAAVVAQVLERKADGEKRMSVDHLSTICTLAVRESLANVFGDKFDCFVSNFEKSFQSTLRTLRLISESSQNGVDHFDHLNIESSNLNPPTSLSKEGSASNSDVQDCQSEVVFTDIGTQEQLSIVEETGENMITDSMNQELALHERTNLQLACVSLSRLGSHSSMTNHSMLSTFEKSVVEQARSNDLKTYELGLTMKKLQMKEAQLALSSHSNLLERLKLSMGISKASFKAEKLKTQLKDTRHAELLKNCVDCLVAGLLIMSGSLTYGAYVHSYKRITEATASCKHSEESKSWWIPKKVASLNSGLHFLWCQVQVLSRMLFGVLMILAIAYLLLQRSEGMKQTMPVTFILLLLGVACGFAGKMCVDTLGGDGVHWLVYWEALCLLHFLFNIWTSALFLILHGPITVLEGAKGAVMFPYWLRRFVFYSIVLLFLPLCCGLMPFAGPGEWKDHFLLLLTDSLHMSD